MANDLDTLPVRVGDIRQLERVLETAGGLVVADDLARQFRNMRDRPAPSNLARAIDEQLTRVRGWLRDAEEVVIDPDE